jgi:hypothetical protein
MTRSVSSDLLHQISDGHDLVSIGGIPRFIP